MIPGATRTPVLRRGRPDRGTALPLQERIRREDSALGSNCHLPAKGAARTCETVTMSRGRREVRKRPYWRPETCQSVMAGLRADLRYRRAGSRYGRAEYAPPGPAPTRPASGGEPAPADEGRRSSAARSPRAVLCARTETPGPDTAVFEVGAAWAAQENRKPVQPSGLHCIGRPARHRRP